jgi:hypothetical protein
LGAALAGEAGFASDCTNSAAAVAVQMKSAFQPVRFGLMVGIGGGVPSEEADIRLGDEWSVRRTRGMVEWYNMTLRRPLQAGCLGAVTCGRNFLTARSYLR